MSENFQKSTLSFQKRSHQAENATGKWAFLDYFVGKYTKKLAYIKFLLYLCGRFHKLGVESAARF